MASACTACGNSVAATDQYCWRCGQALARPRTRSGVRRRFRLRWPVVVLGLAIIIVLIFVGMGLGSHHVARNPSVVVPSSTANTPPATSSTPAASGSSSSAPPTTSSGGWSSVSERYGSGTVSMELPSALNHVTSATSGQWSWGDQSYGVTLVIAPHKDPKATNSLGTGVFGTPITTTPSGSSQVLDVKWPSHGWVEVRMQVPKTHQAWLGRIARSVSIT